ncbi:hypothetical protein [Solirubrobacter soli]|uniref:hypothetical protein n=1 Tax=Solirubrobacter soli TaxID=363832 RepID=UPI000401AC6E|nr:hypothetical protein [Solirubrobacter soli]
MNLRRHLNVLRRFRVIVAGGVILGIALGTLAIFKVSTSGLEWRSTQTYQSTSTLNVTQHGFPDGRVILADSNAADPNSPAEVQKAKSSDQFADPGRFANLAITYAYYAQSDAVRKLIQPTPDPEQVTITPVPAGWNTSATLPLLTLQTMSENPDAAKKLNQSVITALRGYIESEQARNNIPPDNRVRIDILTPPSKAAVLIGHSKTPAIIAFILVMAATFALAYVLDNLYPPKSGVADDYVPLESAPVATMPHAAADLPHVPATPSAPLTGGWSSPPSSSRRAS